MVFEYLQKLKILTDVELNHLILKLSFQLHEISSFFFFFRIIIQDLLTDLNRQFDIMFIYM